MTDLAGTDNLKSFVSKSLEKEERACIIGMVIWYNIIFK